ncbi:MAG: 6-phosphogluconolactonase, partial [Alphaproteobacteria bacterium]|nr:6-phosphogluconolactonase [Alphaproteobacteria bacterium]
SDTRVVELAEQTRRANARHFGGAKPVPRRAITIGLQTIVSAREVVVAATGSAKAGAVRGLLGGVDVDRCPAAVLRDHPNCRLIVDAAAAGLLP